MMNSRKLLGDSLPAGAKRVTWNLLMGLTLVVTGTASIATAWGAKLAIGGTVLPIGKTFIIGYGIAIVIGHFYLQAKLKNKEA